jgi:hypothetical protein
VKGIKKIQEDIISILKNDEPLLEHKLSHYLDDVLNSQQEKLKNLVKVVLRTFYTISSKSSIQINLRLASDLLRNRTNYEGNQAYELLVIVKEINQEVLAIASEDNEVIFTKDDNILEIKMNKSFGISDLISSLQRFRNIFRFQRYFSEVLEQNVCEEKYRIGLRTESEANMEGILTSFTKALFSFAKDQRQELISEVSKIEIECKAS